MLVDLGKISAGNGILLANKKYEGVIPLMTQQALPDRIVTNRFGGWE